MREARLELVVADLLVAGCTLRAVAAATNERQRDPITDAPRRHALTDRLYDACEFVPGHMRQHDIRVVPLPAVPVAETHAARHDLENDAASGCYRVRDLLDFEWA
jgi:hypothetical protein